MSRATNNILRWAIDQGWQLQYTPRGHMRWSHPHVARVFLSDAPADPTALDSLVDRLQFALRIADHGDRTAR